MRCCGFSPAPLLLPARLAPHRSRRIASLRCLPASDDIPSSLEDCLSGACSSLRALLPSSKKNKGLRRLAVEVPVLDTSRETLQYLAGGLSLELSSGGPVSVVFDDDAPFPETVPHATVVTRLGDAARARLTARLLIVAPSDVEEVFRLLDEVWRGQVVVLLNPDWEQEEKVPEGFRNSFQVVYSFLPLAVQGLLGKKEGVLLKRVKRKGDTAKWMIFVKEADGFKCVGQQVGRPKDAELELALYNAAVVDSPISRGMRFLRGLGKS